MKIISFNLNGIRSAARKGFFAWMLAQDADVICLQETKAQQSQLTDSVFSPAGYHAYFFDAEKKGYSGVAIYTRHTPDTVVYGLGWPDVDSEGRYLQADFGELSIGSLYLPSGSSSEERQAVKFDVMERLLPRLQHIRSEGRHYVLCGDWNIAHKKIDIKNWRGNQKNSGFLPEERAWLDTVFDELGFVDAFRVVNGEADQYTWWSNRGQAWANNTGWRIDYHVITPALADKVLSANVYKTARFSDHAPLTLTYDYHIR